MEYRTTQGAVEWDAAACYIEKADDPVPPDGDGWELVCSSTGEMRYSRQPIFWFWRRRCQAGPL